MRLVQQLLSSLLLLQPTVVAADNTFASQSFTCNDYDKATGAPGAGTVVYSDNADWKISNFNNMPQGLGLIQTPLKDTQSFFTPKAVVELDFMTQHTMYYLAIPESSFVNNNPPAWTHNALWSSTQHTMSTSNGQTGEREQFVVFSKTLRPDETLTLRALCECDAACPTNYLLFYKHFGPNQNDNNANCECHTWGDPHSNNFANTWLDVGKGWLEMVRTQDCSVRVQAYARNHWGALAVTAYLMVQVGESYFGFDYSACDKTKADPNVDISTLTDTEINFHRHVECQWWVNRNVADRPFLLWKNDGTDDGTILTNVNGASKHFIIRNDALGVEIDVRLPHQYTIKIKGQALKERTGYGLCGECGGNVRTERETENGEECGSVENINIIRKNWAVMDQLSDAYQVPDDQIYWKNFNKASGNPMQADQYTAPICHDNFCKTPAEEFALGDPEIPQNENCAADTCQPPEEDEVTDSRAECLTALTNDNPTWTPAAVNDKYLQGLKACYDQTVLLGGHSGDDCMVDFCTGAAADPLPVTEEACALPANGPSPGQIVSHGDYEYATLPYTTGDATGSTCLAGAARPPSGWAIVHDGDDPFFDQANTRFGAECLYTATGGVSMVQGAECPAAHFMENEEEQCFELSTCEDAILLRRPKDACGDKDVTFEALKGEDNIAGHLEPHVIDLGQLTSYYVDNLPVNADLSNLPSSSDLVFDVEGLSDSLTSMYAELRDKIEPGAITVSAVGLYTMVSGGHTVSHVCGITAVKGFHAAFFENTFVREEYPEQVNITVEIEHADNQYLKWGARTIDIELEDTYTPLFGGYSMTSSLKFKRDDIVGEPQWKHYFRGWCVHPVDMKHFAAGEGLKVKFSGIENVDEIVLLHQDENAAEPKLLKFQDTTQSTAEDNYVLEFIPKC